MLTTVSVVYATDTAGSTGTVETNSTSYQLIYPTGTYYFDFEVTQNGLNMGPGQFTFFTFPASATTADLVNCSRVPFAGTDYLTIGDDYTVGSIGSFTITFSTDATVDFKTNNKNYTVSYSWSNTPPVAPTQGYTTIEAGNIVYFDMGTGKAYDLLMQSAFYSYSGVLSGTWPDDNRRYGFVDELPAANTNFAESAGTSILWSDDTDGQTILGTNNKGVATISGTTTGRYMWVINPLYNNKYYDDALNAKAINGVMKIYGVPSGTTVYTYKLKQNATSLGLDNVIPSVSGGVGTVSENEGEQTPFTSTDDNETPYTQTVGGDTSAPETVSAIEGVRQTLDQFVNAFLNLLTAPADHIQQLISAGSAFMQAITGIFTWLPNSVVDVFTSALILMIVIGVLKMLL